MKLRIVVDNREHYRVYRRYFGFLWFEQHLGFSSPWFNYYYDAEKHCELLCKKEKLKKLKPKVVKEIKCT